MTQETSFLERCCKYKMFSTSGMEHVIPVKELQVTDTFLGRIITKTQTETEYITSPGTMLFSLRTLLIISCHPDWTFSFNVKYDYCLPFQVPSVPFIDILMLASAFLTVYSLCQERISLISLLMSLCIFHWG